MNKQLKITSYTNQETGEYSEKRQYVDMQFNDDGYLLFKNRYGVKSYLDIPLPNALTWAEKGRIEALKHYILRDNQLLVCRSNNTIKPITALEICKIADMSDRQCKTFIKKLKEYKIIREVNIGGVLYFCFNPIFGMKDKRLTLTTFIIFQEELKEYLPKWVYQKFVEQAKEIEPNIKMVK